LLHVVYGGEESREVVVVADQTADQAHSSIIRLAVLSCW
jgi:hypothetical protein